MSVTAPGMCWHQVYICMTRAGDRLPQGLLDRRVQGECKCIFAYTRLHDSLRCAAGILAVACGAQLDVHERVKCLCRQRSAGMYHFKGKRRRALPYTENQKNYKEATSLLPYGEIWSAEAHTSRPP